MTFKTADLCDKFGEEVHVVDPLFQIFGGRTSFGGPIATVEVFEDNVLVREVLAQPGEGRVLVVEAGGSLHVALLGGELAMLARDNGWQGVLLFGCVRDVAELAEIDLGVRALASCPRRSAKRGRGSTGHSLHFAGVAFRPDHYLYADQDGIIVAPRDLLAGE